MENVPLRDLLWRVCVRRKLRPRQVTGDTTYGTIENIVAVEDAGIRAFFPLPDFDHRTTFFGKGDFTHDTAADVYRCPGEQTLRFRTHKHAERIRIYRADMSSSACAKVRNRRWPENETGRGTARPVVAIGCPGH